MIRVVLLTTGELDRELRSTVLWRNNVERHLATTAEQVARLAAEGRADIVIIDSLLPGAAAVVAALRQDPFTRGLSIIGIGRADFGFAHLDVLEAGANAILALPPGPDWDDRLERLMHVPVRRVARFPVSVTIEGGLQSGGGVFSAETLNLSVHGMLIRTTMPLDVGEDVQFAFELPDGQGSIQGRGTIVRQAHTGQFGVELEAVDGDGRVRIKRYVESARG